MKKWTKTELAAFQTGLRRVHTRLAKERPKRMEWTAAGIRYVSGTGDAHGVLEFHADGSVQVVAAERALFFAMFPNRAKVKPHLPNGSRTPAFETAHHFQRLAEQGHNFPPDWRDPDAAMQLATIHTAAVWPLVLALAAGDSKPLRDLAAAVDVLSELKNPKMSETHLKLLSAVKRTAEAVGAPPTRKAVFEAYEADKTIPPEERTWESFRQSLETLGFAWLAGKTGRPRKGGVQ